MKTYVAIGIVLVLVVLGVLFVVTEGNTNAPNTDNSVKSAPSDNSFRDLKIN